MKGKTFILLILFLLLIIPTVVTAEGKYSKLYKSKYSQIKYLTWNRLEKNNDRLSTPEEFLFEVDYYVEKISNYLNMEKKLKYFKKNKIGFTFWEGSSVGAKPTIYLNRRMFEADLAPIAHVITIHLLNYSYNSNCLSLYVGLASILQNKFGKNPAAMIYKAPIIQLSKQFTNKTFKKANKKRKVVYLVGREVGNVYFNDNNLKTVRALYILSASFCRYLIDQNGINNFLKVCKAKNTNEAYKKIYGLSLKRLKKNWLNYLKNQEDFKYTYVEWLKKIVKESGYKPD